MIDAATLKSRARGIFDALANSDITNAIEEASRYVSATNWAARFDDGIFYLACHILTEFELLVDGSANGGVVGAANVIPTGAIKSEKILSWSASYIGADDGVFSDALGTTSWGRMFIARRRSIFSERVL